MDTLTIIAYALILYGVFNLYTAWAKPKTIWNIGKIQGFVQLLSEKGQSSFLASSAAYILYVTTQALKT